MDELLDNIREAIRGCLNAGARTQPADAEILAVKV